MTGRMVPMNRSLALEARLAALLAILAAACSSSSGAPFGDDAGVNDDATTAHEGGGADRGDAAADEGANATSDDATIDAVTDSTTEGAGDAPIDASADSPSAEPDASADAAPDGPGDAEVDASVETLDDAGADATDGVGTWPYTCDAYPPLTKGCYLDGGWQWLLDCEQIFVEQWGPFPDCSYSSGGNVQADGGETPSLWCCAAAPPGSVVVSCTTGAIRCAAPSATPGGPDYDPNGVYICGGQGTWQFVNECVGGQVCDLGGADAGLTCNASYPQCCTP
jgi:hypothetical protein